MKTLVYFQLCDLESELYLPQEILGWFKIGNDVTPIIFDHKGTILFEYQWEGKLDITLADKAFLEFMKIKKIPSNVVVYCNEFPCGGWD